MKILKGSANYLHYVEQVQQDKLSYLMLNLPFSCNFRCLKCCNGEREHSKSPIDLNKIKGYIEEAKENGFRVLVLAGEGETTLYKNFRDLIQFSSKIGMIPYIFTNGSLINEDLALFLSECDASLIINIDSFDPQQYDVLVGKKGAFETVEKNVSIIKEIYRQKIYKVGDYTITSLAINLVLNNDNFNQIERLKDFCGDEIVPVINQPIKIGSADSSWDKYDKTENVETEKENYPLGTLLGDDYCSYLKNGISINSDGEILTCAYALESCGLYGSFNDNITLKHREVMLSIHDFYEQYGQARCIVRHPQYLEFINFLERRKNGKE